MRAVIAIALAVGLSAVGASGEIPPEVLALLKDATVLVNASGRYAESSGSGFVLAAKDKFAYIVTNAHTTELGGKPADVVSVVFNSGQSGEKTINCDVLDRDEDLDLAVLKVSVDKAPKPLSLAGKVDVRETMDVHIVGFPFGRALALGGGNPAVTIGKGTVSSLRKDAQGNLLAVQIDGDVNPGNSGGPIVTKDGKLIGICVAKISNTGIGLAIPVPHLQAMLRGRVKSVAFSEGNPAGGNVPVDVTVTIINPMRNIKQTTLLLLPEEKAPSGFKPKEDGSWEQLAQAVSCQLTIGEGKASGHTQLATFRDRRSGYWYQVQIVDADQKVSLTEPQKTFVSPNMPVGAVTAKPAASQPDDWLGQTAGAAIKAGDGNDTAPVAVSRTLAGRKINLDGATAVQIDLAGGELVENALWAADGKSFLAAGKDGVLRIISTPGLTEIREMNIHTECGAICQSAEGIVLLAPTRGEIWLIDDKKLDVRRRIPVRGVKAVAVAAASSYAVAATGDQSKADYLIVIDLKTGGTVKQYDEMTFAAQAGKTLRRHETSAILRAFDAIAMTADGKCLLVVNQGCLHRFAVKAGNLEYEEAGPKIVGPEGGRIETSIDSRYVAVLCGAGNARVDDHSDIGMYGTYVYSATDLQQPVLTLQQGAYPRTLAFDKKRRVLYSQNFDTQCIVFETNGRLAKKWLLPNAGASRLHVLSADCSQMLTLTDSSLFWINLSDDKPSPQAATAPR